MRYLYRFYPSTTHLGEYRHAISVCKKYKCRKVLDVGCGNGGLCKVLTRHGVDVYVGIDINDVFRHYSPRCTYIVSDARNPPLETDTKYFDCILFVNSIFYIGLQTIENYRRIGKYLVIIDIDPRYPHVWIADRLESRGRGMRIPRNKLVEILRQRYTIHDTGGLITYYIVFS